MKRKSKQQAKSANKNLQKQDNSDSSMLDDQMSKESKNLDFDDQLGKEQVGADE